MTSLASPNPVPRKSLSDVVYERLREEIVHGEIEDNTPLSQVQLAQRYGVSRIPIREALRRLQAESLIVATPYHPFVVRTISAAQMLELIDIRGALEDLALARREPFTENELVELRAINDGFATAEDADSVRMLDRGFHRLLLGRSSGTTTELLEDVRLRIHKYLNSMNARRPGGHATLDQHAQILLALEHGDSDAARQALRQHIQELRAFVYQQFMVAGEAAVG